MIISLIRGSAATYLAPVGHGISTGLKVLELFMDDELERGYDIACEVLVLF